MLKKEDIVKLLETDDRAVIRALLVLHERQTDDEKRSEDTRHENGVGFRSCDAKMGSSMAKFFQRNQYLTPKQIAYWRKRDKRGNMRIAVYWRQLMEAAEQKAARKAVATPAPVVPADAGRDYGNDMERRMVLQEQLNDVLDSDDPKLIEPLKKEIDELDDFWARIRGSQGK